MRGLLLSLAVLMVSCGQMAVDGHYRGEPLFAIRGTVSVTATRSDLSGELRVALFWARPGSAGGAPLDAVTAVEQEVGTASSFPARVALTVHERPGAELIATAPDVQGTFALGMLLVYLDVDGDGRWDRGLEELVGAAPDAVVVYAPAGLTGGRYGTLAAGFHLLARAPGAVCDAPLASAEASEVPIVVDMRFPAAALGDIDCDGGAEEWSGTCPSPATVWSMCRNNATPDALCSTCEPLLWAEGSPDVSCDSWLGSCAGFTSDDECEEAWEQCREEGADEVEPPEGDTTEPPEQDSTEPPEQDTTEPPEQDTAEPAGDDSSEQPEGDASDKPEDTTPEEPESP